MQHVINLLGDDLIRLLRHISTCFLGYLQEISGGMKHGPAAHPDAVLAFQRLRAFLQICQRHIANAQGEQGVQCAPYQ